MRPDDVAAAERATSASLFGDEGRAPEQVARARRRIAHLLETDPGGAWIADAGGEIVGASLALVREGVWGLSLLGLLEAHQGHGHGRSLLRAAWDHGRDARGWIILSSSHPAAIRAYASLGLDLRPCVAAAGIVDRERLGEAVGVRDAGEAGIDVADAIGRAVRGAGHGRELRVALEHPAARLLVVEDRAFALLRDSHVQLVAGLDEEAATRALEGALAAAPRGSTVSVDFLTAGQDWAIRACLSAGLALSPDGPVFTAGALGPLRPYVPSGPWL